MKTSVASPPPAPTKPGETIAMVEEEREWRGQLLAEFKGLRANVARIEKRLEKDSDEVFERLRKAEVAIALQDQLIDTERHNSRRQAAIVASIVSCVGAAIVSAIAAFL